MSMLVLSGLIETQLASLADELLNSSLSKFNANNSNQYRNKVEKNIESMGSPHIQMLDINKSGVGFNTTSIDTSLIFNSLDSASILSYHTNIYPLLASYQRIKDVMHIIVVCTPDELIETYYRQHKLSSDYAIVVWRAYYLGLVELLRDDAVYILNKNLTLLTNKEVEVQEYLSESSMNLRELNEYVSEQTSNYLEISDHKNNADTGFYLQRLIEKHALERTAYIERIELLKKNKQIETELLLLESSLSHDLMRPFRKVANLFPKTSTLLEKFTRSSVILFKTSYFKVMSFFRDMSWDIADTTTNELKAFLGRDTGKKRIVVYTAIYGSYDALMLPNHLNPDYDYVCFTDHELNTFGVWQLLKTPYYHPDSTRMARYAKLHPHDLFTTHDVAIWVDSNILINCNLQEYIDKVIDSKSDVGLIKHPKRNCVYIEGEACKIRSKDESGLIDEQLRYYMQINYPENAGLFETNLMVTNLRSGNISKFYQRWWSTLSYYSKRDQLSIGLAIQQSDVNVSLLMNDGISVRNTDDFYIYKHELCRIFRTPKQLDEFIHFERPKIDSHTSVTQSIKRSIDIIICVHNALAVFTRCIKSVLEHLGDNQKIIIVDDASDTETKEYIEQLAIREVAITVLRNETNLGYTSSANRGLNYSQADLRIMLNSDTIVTASWAENMKNVAFSSELIGIVGPISNAASYQSIPSIKGKKGQTAINSLPDNLNVEVLSEYCAKWKGARPAPRVPLVHGFCFGIKKQLIEKIGCFDESNFAKYYGEENDYCFRARKAGYELAIATDTFIFHEKSMSIAKEERLIYMDNAGKKLRELYSSRRVKEACSQMRDHPELVQIRKRADALFSEYQSKK